MRRDLIKACKDELNSIQSFVNICCAHGTEERVKIDATDEEIEQMILNMGAHLKSLVIISYAVKMACAQRKKFKNLVLALQNELAKEVVGVDLEGD